MDTLPMERVILIALLERMLKKELMNKEDLIEMRQFSMNLLAEFAESVDSKVVNSAHQSSREVSHFFEAYLRGYRNRPSKT